MKHSLQLEGKLHTCDAIHAEACEGLRQPQEACVLQDICEDIQHR